MPRETISVTHLTNITQMSNQLNWTDFEIPAPNGTVITAQNFPLIAIGTPNQEKEQWDMEMIDERYKKQKDLIYALVIDGKLLKLGKSITTMKERVKSYHCGKNAYREKEKSTNSPTNWYILQSVLAINKPVYIYAMYIPKTMGTFMGWSYHNRISKEVESILLAEFYKKYGFKPIGNKQK